MQCVNGIKMDKQINGTKQNLELDPHIYGQWCYNKLPIRKGREREREGGRNLDPYLMPYTKFNSK